MMRLSMNETLPSVLFVRLAVKEGRWRFSGAVMAVVPLTPCTTPPCLAPHFSSHAFLQPASI
ncbi:hypothetical protein E2C01_088537 [Portunus trituberculatus]|uniref:Uncharacterized protein n=1 Tax=Portunus trituberculatus TaxID=210409 RepID=A0A5B7J6G5_PORTR|nr:hypothetical protein [Portunus trituberculatus]